MRRNMVAKWPKQKNRNERYDGSEMMGKIVWKGEILPGMRDEYFRRHDEIWPEMATALKESGITNYSIWNHGNELIG